MASNMKKCLSSFSSLANQFNNLWTKATAPMDEENAVGVVNEMSSLAQDMQLEFQYLINDINQCKSIISTKEEEEEEEPKGFANKPLIPKQIVQELLEEEGLAPRLVTLKEYVQEKGKVTESQLHGRIARTKKLKPVIKGLGGHKGAANKYSVDDLDKFMASWKFAPNLGCKGKKPVKVEPKETLVKTNLVSLSDFVDQYDLDVWRSKRLKDFLQGAYYDRAVTYREERKYGPTHYYVYPQDQLEVAAARWAYKFFGAKKLLTKKG